MIEQPDIDRLLAGPLGTWLEEQNARREAAKALSRDRWWKAAFVLGPLIVFGLILIPLDLGLKLFGAGVLASLAYGWGQQPRKQAVQEVKQGINRAIAEALELTYDAQCEPDTGFDLAKTFAMLPGYTRSSFEDCWSGDLSGHAFRLYEAHLEQRRRSNKRTYYVTVFLGVIMRIAASRDVQAITLLERTGKHKGWLGGVKERLKLGGTELELVDQVHPDFMDRFTIWSTDQVEARYLIDPAYAERLLEIEQAFAGKNIRALFHRGELVLVVQTPDNFESGSIHARDDRARLTRTVEQFTALANLALWMNTR